MAMAICRLNYPALLSWQQPFVCVLTERSFFMKPLTAKICAWAIATALALILAYPPVVLKVNAAEPAPAEKPEAKSAQPDKKKTIGLDEVVVRGEATQQALDATSATVLDHDQIVDRIYTTPLDMLTLSPGISIQQYHQGGTASAFQMRGFTSCSHGPDAAIFLDGVPLNETDGYADTNIIIPEEIERVEIIKGPSSALYGNYASAGVVHFVTIKQGDFTHVGARYGSFNTQEGVFTMARRDAKLDQVYAGQIYHTDGYQDNSNWNKQNAAGRWTYRFTDRLDATVGFRFFNSTWDAPGYITQSVYDSRPSSAVSDVNGGKKKRVDGRVDLRYRLTDESKLMFYSWGYSQDFTRWYQNWISSSQTPGRNYGNERLFQRQVAGAGASYNFKGKLWERETSLILGLDFMREDDNRERWNLVVGNGRNRGSKYEDYNLILNTTSLYGELDFAVFKPLRLILGARLDSFSGDLDDKMPAASYDLSGPNVFSPKAGLIYTVKPDWEVFANYGRGFALPRDKTLFQDNNLNPAIRTQYELGTRAKPTKWLDFMVTLWRLDTTDDIQAKLDDPTQQENAGETRRQGVEAAFNVYPLANWYFHADYAYIDSEYLKYSSGGVSYDGKTLSSVPDHIVNLEVGYAPSLGLGGRLRYRYVSDRYIDSANTFTLDGHQVVNAQVSYTFSPKYRLELDVINLFDEKYANYAGYTNGEMTYAPEDPLSVYLTLRVHF
jgi:iron complex outermembrane receptor protein